jgi:predicted tellurium resistance membrane protein TerC
MQADMLQTLMLKWRLGIDNCAIFMKHPCSRTGQRQLIVICWEMLVALVLRALIQSSPTALLPLRQVVRSAPGQT